VNFLLFLAIGHLSYRTLARSSVSTGRGEDHVPFVVQAGKWRREVFLPQVTACVDNPVPAESSRLPRNRSEGDLPQLAVVTAGATTLDVS
jgi:hypothetical protein